MRICSITLDGFGALSGRYEFSAGLNVVAGPNEAGKSTMHQALRVGLCGLGLPARGRRPRETEEVLRHYRPWGGSDFQVTVEVEIGDNRYQIVRDLERSDSSAVWDAVRGGDVTDEFRRGRSVDVAVRMGMTRETFLALATVAQSQILDLDATALQEDLQRAAASTGGRATARGAIDRLQQYRREFIGGDRASTRPLSKVTAELDAVVRQLEAATAQREALAEQYEQERALRERLGEADEALQAAQTAWWRAELAELDAELRALAELNRALAEVPELPLPPNPDAVREATAGVEELGNQVVAATTAIAELTPDDPVLAALASTTSSAELTYLAGVMEEAIPALPPQRRRPAGLAAVDRGAVRRIRWATDLLGLLGGIGGVLLLLYALLAPSGQSRPAEFVGGIVLLLVVGAGVTILTRHLRRMLAAGGFTSVREMRRAAAAAENDPEVAAAIVAQQAALSRRTEARARLDALELPDGAPRLRQLAAGITEIQAALTQLTAWQQTLERVTADVGARAARAGLEVGEPAALALALVQAGRSLRAAEEAAVRRRSLEAQRDGRLAGRQLDALDARAADLRQRLAARRANVRAAPVPSAAAGRERAEAAQAVAEALRGELLPLEARVAERTASLPDIPALEERRAELEGQLNRLRAVAAAVDLALRALETAEERVHRTLAPRLAAALAGWIPRVTVGRYTRVWVDPETLAIHVSPSGSHRQISLGDLSQGTQEQAYLCLRLVLAQLLSPSGDPVPMLLDDPFVNCDDERCDALLESLATSDGGAQIIVFSHETRVATWARRRSVPLIALQRVPVQAGPAGAAPGPSVAGPPRAD